MSLYLRKIDNILVLRGGRWVDEKVEKKTRFIPLPYPFQAGFELDHLADNINVTSPDIVQAVVENVRKGKKDGTVYGLHDRTQYGDTRSEVKYSDLFLA